MPFFISTIFHYGYPAGAYSMYGLYFCISSYNPLIQKTASGQMTVLLEDKSNLSSAFFP